MSRDEALRLLLDPTRELAALAVVDLVGGERLGGGDDRRDRRPEVVAHRAQQGGLDDVAAPQGAGLHDVAEQLVALLRRAEQGLQRRDDALLRAAQRRLRQVGGQQQRADLARVLPQREGDAALVALHGTQLDRRRRDADRLREPLRADGQDGRQVLAAQEQAGELREEVGLTAALLGLLRAVARGLGEGAGDERHDEEHRQRHPVLRLGDREAARRRDVEPVERQGGRERRDAPKQRAPPDRHDEDADQVDDDERRDRRDLLEGEDQQRRERHADHADERPRPRVGPAVAEETERIASRHGESVDRSCARRLVSTGS